MNTDLVRIPQLRRGDRLPDGLYRVSRNLAMRTVPSEKWALRRKIRLLRISEALRNSGPGTYATLEAASTIYGADVRVERRDFELAVTTSHARANTEVGVNSAFRPAKVTRRRRGKLPAEAFTFYDGRPVVEKHWLILEFLALPDFRRALVNAEAVLRLLCPANGFFRNQVEEVFAAVLRKLRKLADSHPYARRRILRRLQFLSPWSMSIQESELKAQMIEAGLPPVSQQVPVIVGGEEFFLDFAWPKLSIAVEFDGLVKYKTQAHDAVVREKLREDLVREVFPTFLRFVTADLRSSRRLELLRSKFPRSWLRRRVVLS